jgi:P4 family phage/plasmid primase-like protien
LTLRQRLGEDEFFIRYFKLALRYYERECIQTEDTKRKVRNLKRVIEQLSDTGRRKRILEDSIERFHVYRPTFAEDLDVSNRLVFSNGVFDYTTFEFRDGRPDDLVSIPLKFHYQPMDQGSADCNTVMDFMSSIQPDVATRDYLLTLMSLCTSVDTTMQHFWIFTGQGANGKSKLMNLLMEALSDHYGTAPAALLTRRREDANQANESLSALEKCRVAVFSEGSATEILQVNTIKLFTGEDVITTRGLHEKQRRWKPKFKCILVCNDIPKLDDSSWAAWRRIKVVHFPTSYVENPVRPHERQKDPLIGEKLSRCLWAFVAILIEYYRRFKTAGLLESEAITKATQQYQTENDIVDEFCQEHLVDEDGHVEKWMDILNAFRSWAKALGRPISPNKAAVKKLFENRMGTPANEYQYNGTKHGWKGIRLV